MATNYGNGSWAGVLFDREAIPDVEYLTLPFIVGEPTLTITQTYTGEFTRTIALDVPEPAFAISGIRLEEDFFYGDVPYVCPEPELSVDITTNSPLSPDIFNPVFIDAELDIIIRLEVPYGVPPGGLLEADGQTLILSAVPDWEPEV